VSKASYHVGAALGVFVACFLWVQGVHAQIAPTSTATISGSLSDASGKPVAQAKISLRGPRNASTQTDTQGLFVVIGLPFGTYQISAAAPGFGTVMRSISVEGDTNVAIQYEPASTNGLKIIANVSALATAQFNVTAASVTQVNPRANAFEGKTSWRTILEQIPGLAQGGLGIGNTEQAGFPDGPFVPVELSINGALPYESATLLDDMPLIGSGSFNNSAGYGTNLNMYPLNGFNASDVVRGPGADAPSIVDSIGGSFVLHPGGVVATNHYDLSLSTDPYGGIIANALVAVRWKKLSVTLTRGMDASPGPAMSQGYLPGFLTALGVPGLLNGQPFEAYLPPSGTTIVDPRYYIYGSPATLGYRAGLFGFGINSQSTTWSMQNGSLALEYSFSPGLSAELFYAGQHSVGAFPYSEYELNFQPPSGYTGAMPPGVQYGAYNFAFPSTQTSSLLEEKLTAKLGQGTLRLAALQNRTFLNQVTDLPNVSTVKLYGAGYLNGSSTLTYFNGGTYSLAQPYGCEFAEMAFSNNRDLSLSYMTPLGNNFHTGLSFVQSYYDNPTLTLGTYTDITGAVTGNYFGSTPSAISQTTDEMRFLIGGNLSEKTSIDLSMYFVNANYHVPNPSDPNIDTTTYDNATYVDSRYTYAAPRLGFVWRPTAPLAFRAAVGGGFAEAPLSSLIGVGGLPTINSTSTPTSYLISLANLNLQPEKSFGFDVGTDIRLPRGTILSFDLYRTNLFGQFYTSTAPDGTYTGNYGTLPLYTTQQGNLGRSRYEGLLLDVRHDSVTHGIYWAFSGGLTRGYVVNIPSGLYNGIITSYLPPTYAPVSTTCTHCANLNVVPGINFNGTFESTSVPYSQALGIIGYRWSPEKYVGLTSTYYGNNNTYNRLAFVEIDGNVGYPLSKFVSLLVTFQNITNIYGGGVNFFSAANIEEGYPNVVGPPGPRYGEEYGPRTVRVTTQFHL